jgi:hypothetical protein
MAPRTLRCAFTADRIGLILEAACNGYVSGGRNELSGPDQKPVVPALVVAAPADQGGKDHLVVASKPENLGGATPLACELYRAVGEPGHVVAGQGN